MSTKLKALAGVAVLILGLIGFMVYLWWIDLSVGDFYFFKGPDEVIDETIFAAQEDDKEGFKRLLTKESVEILDDIHVWSTGWIESPNGIADFQDGSLVTWDTVMATMAAQGGFELDKELTWEDNWTEDELTLTIVFDGRKKAYRMVKKMGIWRIDLTKDPVIARAEVCMRNERICRKRSRGGASGFGGTADDFDSL